MKVLLITTLPNMVVNVLQKQTTLELTVVNCQEFIHTGQCKTDIFLQSISVLCPDIILTYRCPFIIPEYIYSTASKGAYNLHPSLLPKYAGLNPWEDMMKSNDRYGGVTLHRLSMQIDCGEIIVQRKIRIHKGETFAEIRDRVDKLAAKTIEVFLNKKQME